jgi:hypothetical protein
MRPWLAAAKAQCDVWEFAIDLSELRSAGVTSADLRCLLCDGSIAHAEEHFDEAATHRVFRPLPTLVLPERSCFVLTETGLAVTEALATMTDGPASAAMVGSSEAVLRPRWDKVVRELWWGELLVKRFLTRANSQEMLLDVLEEEGWPPRIDDPLPRDMGQDAAQRLHDAIRSLNRNQVHAVLMVRRDGTGEGVLWSERPLPLPHKRRMCAGDGRG